MDQQTYADSAPRYAVGPWSSIEEIRAANEATGQVWFSEETMRWWDTVILPRVYGGRYFVTSEAPADSNRRYTVRRALDNSTVETHGEFMAYGTRREASNAAIAAWTSELDMRRGGPSGE
jgi:hypothetical protein